MPDPKSGAWTERQVHAEMAMRQTGMAFQRTRMSTERTLMSVIRTALSLIGFGFTIFQVFSHLTKQLGLQGHPHAARNFGMALVVLAIVFLTLGMVSHVRYMRELRVQRESMIAESLIHGQTHYPPSLALITAVLLWLLALLAIANMAFGLGTLG